MPIRAMLVGGSTDCRNRTLQKLFLLIHAAEHAGSGVPKILRAWKAQGWRAPLIRERVEPEETILRLPLSSVIPIEVTGRLRSGFGDRFDTLDPVDRSILGTAEMEGVVTNSRVRDLRMKIHPVDITRRLRNLVDQKYLISRGATKGSYYVLNLPAPTTDLHEPIEEQAAEAATTPQAGSDGSPTAPTDPRH